MTDRQLSLIDLNERVIRAGHLSFDQSPGSVANRLSPPLDRYLVVGANLDPTLKALARRAYYCCLLVSRENPVQAIGDDPAFAMPESFQTAEFDQPALGRFVTGPFRWLLRRLLRFDTILLWPADNSAPGPFSGFAQQMLLDDLTRLSRRLPTDPTELAATGAVVLDLGQGEDCRVLWESAIEVSVSSRDWFFSDADCREVYRMHHHDNVVVSIPNSTRRQELLDELDGLADLIENCSGYVSDDEDEDED